MKTYPMKPHQKIMIDEVKNLNPKRLYYVVIQQNSQFPNLTLNELKKHIRSGIKQYISDFMGYEYRPGLEKKIIQYYCFFEITKEFQQSQYFDNVKNDEVFMGLHFHLFLSSSSGEVHIPQLIYYLFSKLTSQSNKTKSLKKFDYMKIDKLDDHFIQYHTKQFYWGNNSEMIMKNL
jgi:hypothetical protein